MEIQNNKIYSKIRKKWFEITPEEKVRQSFVDYLLSLNVDISYLEEEKQIKIGSKGSKSRFADLIIKKNNLIKEDVVVECKKPKENLFEHKEQAISYAKQLSIKNVMLINGLKEENQIFFIKNNKNEKVWEETYDFIKSFINKQMIKIKSFDRNGLIKKLSEMNNELRTNWGLNDFDAFREINKIIFCKIYAEKKYSDELNHGALTYNFVKEHDFNNQTGIVSLFNELKDSYKNDNVFDANEKIELEVEAIELILTKLNTHNFLTTKEDVKGMVYEHFISQELRGKLGQYFTPRIIIDFILKYLNIQKESKICDPACGTGGFLINYFKSLKNSLDSKELQNIIKNKIFGFDFNETLVKVAKMNMILHGDGHVNMNKQNSLLLNKNNEYDIIVSNPPFGSNNVKAEVASKFTKLKNMNISTKKTEILFLEKIYDILKPNGRAGIVLPLGILNNKNDKKIREFIIKYFKVELIFRIPKNLFFTAKTTIQTCILILKKKRKPKIENYNTKMFYVNDMNFTNYNEYINSTEKKFNQVIQNNYKEDFLVNISKQKDYKLDPGYYIATTNNEKEFIEIGDILKVYSKKILTNKIKENNLQTIKSIDSNGKINLHNKINKTGPHFFSKQKYFFLFKISSS